MLLFMGFFSFLLCLHLIFMLTNWKREILQWNTLYYNTKLPGLAEEIPFIFHGFFMIYASSPPNHHHQGHRGQIKAIIYFMLFLPLCECPNFRIPLMFEYSEIINIQSVYNELSLNKKIETDRFLCCTRKCLLCAIQEKELLEPMIFIYRKYFPNQSSFITLKLSFLISEQSSTPRPDRFE